LTGRVRLHRPFWAHRGHLHGPGGTVSAKCCAQSRERGHLPGERMRACGVSNCIYARARVWVCVCVCVCVVRARGIGVWYCLVWVIALVCVDIRPLHSSARTS
jgi:hypothetical protein